MKNKFNLTIFSICFFTSCFVASCKKEDNFLAAKPDQTLAVPRDLNDYQLLLNNEGAFNHQGAFFHSIYSEPFTVTNDADFANLPANERNAYLWNLNGSVEDENSGWSTNYSRVFYANAVLDGFKNVKYNASEINNFNSLTGTAL